MKRIKYRTGISYEGKINTDHNTTFGDVATALVLLAAFFAIIAAALAG